MPWEFVEEEQSFPQKVQSSGRELGRQIARPIEKTATRLTGLPGDVFSLINQYVARPTSEAITGKSSPYEETALSKILPTTQQQRSSLEKGNEEFFQPKNKVEKFVDDVFEDASLLFVPGGKLIKSAKVAGPGMKVTKNLAKSLGANLAGETVTQVSGSEKAGLATKAGMLFLTSILDTPKAAEEIGKLYSQARNALPQNASQSATNLNSRLSKLKTDISRGRPIGNLSNEEKWVIDQIEKVENLSGSGQVLIDQLWAQKGSLNKELSEKIFEGVHRTARKGIRNRAKQINGIIRDTLEEYGKGNPEFLKNFKSADEAFGTLAKSNFVSNWINDNVRHTPLTEGLVQILGIPSSAIGLAGGYVPMKLLYQISKSPTLAKIYGKAMSAAAKEDSIAFNKYFKQLDDGLQKKQSEEKWEFLD